MFCSGLKGKKERYYHIRTLILSPRPRVLIVSTQTKIFHLFRAFLSGLKSTLNKPFFVSKPWGISGNFSLLSNCKSAVCVNKKAPPLPTQQGERKRSRFSVVNHVVEQHALVVDLEVVPLDDSKGRIDVRHFEPQRRDVAWKQRAQTGQSNDGQVRNVRGALWSSVKFPVPRPVVTT